MVGTKVTILWDMTPCGLVDGSAMLDSSISQQTVILSGNPRTQHVAQFNWPNNTHSHVSAFI